MTSPTYTVLIVDDLQIHRELFRDFLLTDSNCEYHILEAASVKAGIELCGVSKQDANSGEVEAIGPPKATLPKAPPSTRQDSADSTMLTSKIDAILLDYLLPDGDGLEFLAKLHAQSNGSIPPVVMIAGRGDESIAVQAIKLGAEDYLAKFNLSPARLRSAIASAIENARLRLQLQQSNDLLRASIDTIVQTQQEQERFFDLSIDLLATGSFEGYFVRLNPAFERILGFTSAELMAQPFLDFVHPDDVAHTITCARSLNAGVMKVGFENRYRCKDGSYRWLSWNAIPYIEQSLWYAVGRDITAAKQEEIENTQTKAALEARNQELDNFVHIVSHDLKAPLRAVSNLSQWIEEDLAGKVPANTRSQLILLRNRVHRMAATIDGLLDYARISRTADLVEPVCVADLLAETIESLAPPPTFSIVIAPDLPTLDTKRILLFQVFTNLIGNAIVHHDRSDGSIVISCQAVGDFYEFGVTDDGAGIAPENHARIFAIFQTVNPQNRPDSTGIGLAIVKKIIEAEGGNIRLESELGKGTAFYFTWPKSSN
jgi:PAS domain S-box-containing protein